MDRKIGHGREMRRRIRMTREAGQSLVLSRLCRTGMEEYHPVEITISQVGADGVTIHDVLLPDEPVVGGVGGLVAAGLGRRPLALAVARVIDDEDAGAQQLPQLQDRAAAMTQVAGVAVQVQQRPVGARARVPPAVDARAVGAGEEHVAHLGGRRGQPVRARRRWVVDQVVLQGQRREQLANPGRRTPSVDLVRHCRLGPLPLTQRALNDPPASRRAGRQQLVTLRLASRLGLFRREVRPHV